MHDRQAEPPRDADDDILQSYRRLVSSGAIKPDSEQERAAGFLQDLAGRLGESRSPLGFIARHLRKTAVPQRGLYIFGPAGRGKSMLMDLFFDTLPVPSKRRVHFHAFMQQVHAGIADARKQGLDDPVRRAADAIADDADVLCLDEMEISDITDAMLVGRLIERLFDRGATIVTTSNAQPDDLYKGGWNRDLFVPFIALLKDRLEILELASPVDHRRDRPRLESSYHCPLGAAADAAVDAIWQDLCGGQTEAPLVVRAYGHETAFPRSAGRALRCDFEDICGVPFGPADFLALVGQIDVLVLERVPVLSAKRNNEARRFITLIDTLYEAKARLVLSAVAAPDGLYPEGDGAFEFRRTVSRLEEMRSTGWWSEDGVSEKA
jgi:cell division protein ZapE